MAFLLVVVAGVTVSAVWKYYPFTTFSRMEELENGEDLILKKEMEKQKYDPFIEDIVAKFEGVNEKAQALLNRGDQITKIV